MRDDQASRTAEYTALFRALESIRPSESRLFHDPLAALCLTPRYRAALALARLPGVGRRVPRFIDRHWPGPRAAVVARTRMIDDAVEDALAQGVGQVVILGAGFDSRAYRIPGIEQARVLELDHPNTQAAKRRHVEQLTGGVPDHVSFVGIDFNEQRLADALEGAGFRRGEHTFFIWEGVVSYLTPEAVDETLAAIADAGPAGSRLVMTYEDRRALDGSGDFRGAEEAARAVARAGEPFTFGFTPDELPGVLGRHGFDVVEDLSTADAARRYLLPLGRDEPASEFYRVTLARRR